MKRKNHNEKELDQLQKLKHENAKLKRQVSTLRKQLARIDMDRYQELREASEISDTAEQDSKGYVEMLKKEWECHECKNGYLKITLVSQRDRLMYYRSCTNCGNRTRLKTYTDDVKGIKE